MKTTSLSLQEIKSSLLKTMQGKLLLKDLQPKENVEFWGDLLEYLEKTEQIIYTMPTEVPVPNSERVIHLQNYSFMPIKKNDRDLKKEDVTLAILRFLRRNEKWSHLLDTTMLLPIKTIQR